MCGRYYRRSRHRFRLVWLQQVERTRNNGPEMLLGPEMLRSA
jgi:hypothetical protein